MTEREKAAEMLTISLAMTDAKFPGIVDALAAKYPDEYAAMDADLDRDPHQPPRFAWRLAMTVAKPIGGVQ